MFGYTDLSPVIGGWGWCGLHLHARAHNDMRAMFVHHPPASPRPPQHIVFHDIDGKQKTPQSHTQLRTATEQDHDAWHRREIEHSEDETKEYQMKHKYCFFFFCLLQRQNPLSTPPGVPEAVRNVGLFLLCKSSSPKKANLWGSSVERKTGARRRQPQ